MSTTKQMQRVLIVLWVLTGVLFVATILFFAYYPLTQTFEYSYTYPNATDPGVLYSERFKTYNWWKTALYVLAWFPIFWVGLMISIWKVQWPKVVLVVYLAITIAWWTASIIIDIILMQDANDPTISLNNPATDYRRCCVPEFFMVDPRCENAATSSMCTPPVSLGDLHINGDFILAFVYTIVYFASWIVYIVFTVRFWRLTKIIKEDGNTGTTTRKVVITETNTPAYVFTDSENTSMPLLSSSLSSSGHGSPFG